MAEFPPSFLLSSPTSLITKSQRWYLQIISQTPPPSFLPQRVGQSKYSTAVTGGSPSAQPQPPLCCRGHVRAQLVSADPTPAGPSVQHSLLEQFVPSGLSPVPCPLLGCSLIPGLTLNKKATLKRSRAGRSRAIHLVHKLSGLLMCSKQL